MKYPKKERLDHVTNQMCENLEKSIKVPYVTEQSFIKQQQQIAREDLRYFCDEDNGGLEILETLTKQTITNTINHLLAGVEDKPVIPNMLQDDELFQEKGMDGVKGHNQANAKIRQRGAEIISEVS